MTNQMEQIVETSQLTRLQRALSFEEESALNELFILHGALERSKYTYKSADRIKDATSSIQAALELISVILGYQTFDEFVDAILDHEGAKR